MARMGLDLMNAIRRFNGVTCELRPGSGVLGIGKYLVWDTSLLPFSSFFVVSAYCI